MKKNVSLSLATGLILFGAFYRVAEVELFPGWPNFAPMMALAFCAAVYLPLGWAVTLPFSALFISDVMLNAHYGEPMVSVDTAIIFLCYAFAFLVGRGLRNPGWIALLGGTLLNGVVFYLVTNSFSWLTNTDYPHGFSGWFQALTVGVPGHAPTWMFFRNSLVSDVIFTVIFILLFQWERRRLEAPAVKHVPA